LIRSADGVDRDWPSLLPPNRELVVPSGVVEKMLPLPNSLETGQIELTENFSFFFSRKGKAAVLKRMGKILSLPST